MQRLAKAGEWSCFPEPIEDPPSQGTLVVIDGLSYLVNVAAFRRLDEFWAEWVNEGEPFNPELMATLTEVLTGERRTFFAIDIYVAVNGGRNLCNHCWTFHEERDTCPRVAWEREQRAKLCPGIFDDTVAPGQAEATAAYDRHLCNQITADERRRCGE